MTEPSPTSDALLREQLLQAPHLALEGLWNVYAAELQAYLVSVLCDRGAAEDALQDLFVCIARKRGKVASASCLRAYLFRMARNQAYANLRRAKRRRLNERGAEDWLQAGGEGGGADATRIAAALARLPEKQRVVIVLRFYRDMGFREIASALGVSIHTASSRYRYGLEKLSVLLRRNDHENS